MNAIDRMIGFIEELWQSIFTPGATPTLVLATHVTFALLVTLLTVFSFLTRSIHIINLLVLALLLWGTLTWFIAELEKTKDLKDNDQLSKDESGKEESTKVEAPATGQTTSSSTKTSVVKKTRKT